MEQRQEEDQEEDDVMTSNSGKGVRGPGQQRKATMEKPSGGVLQAVEGHTLGTSYKGTGADTGT